MAKKESAAAGPDALRRRADERLAAARGDLGARTGEGPAPADALRLLHELQVHQIELELQNEELQRARADEEDALARYTDLYDHAPVGYLTLAPDSEIRQANLTAASLLGTERAHLIGRRLAPLLAIESRDTFAALLAAALQHGTRETCEVQLQSTGGAPLTLELTATATDDGETCRVVATDVTSRAALEAQLQQARKMEAIATLAGGVAHDFNNILGALLGGLSLMELALEESDEKRLDLRNMKALVARGAELTKQLLAFARRGKYDVRPLDLGRVVEKAGQTFGRLRKDLKIHVDAAPDLRAVLMDEAQLEQVLLALFDNAGDAMRHGGTLRISAENAPSPGADAAARDSPFAPFVKLVVADTGVGMDAATQEHMFEPFFSTKGPGEGTGLGLASVYGIIQSHAGSIAVDTTPGAGTTITLWLPATRQPTAETPALPVSSQVGAGTILVVDDNAMIVDICKRMLEHLGYEVLTASGGAQAIELVRQHGTSISLVILDMVMPDMSGRQTFDALQSIAPGTKVLLASGYSIDGQAQEMLARGCRGFIQKPFDIAALSAKVREVL